MAHEAEKKQYEEDALWHPRPWELWEWSNSGELGWHSFKAGETPSWDDGVDYGRKPDAPKKNCAMCKHSSIEEYACGTARVCNLVGEIMQYINKPCPDWCPLDQPKTELGQQLQAIREKAIENGMPLLSEDEVVGVDQLKEDAKPKCDKCGSSYFWSLWKGGPTICGNPECRNRDQPKEEPGLKPCPLYLAAEDILVWLESFGLTRGSDNVKALRKAVEEVKGK